MSDSPVTDDTDLCLYYFEHSSPSRKVIIALHEQNVIFRPIRIDLLKREQHEQWYLEKVNPKGEVPALKHGDKIIVESTSIIKYIDENLGKTSGLLYPVKAEVNDKVLYFLKAVDSIPTFPLTFGAVVYHTEHVTNVLRWPYCSENVRNNFREMVMNVFSNLRSRSIELKEIPAGKILAEKANAFEKHIKPMLEDVTLYEAFLEQIETTLDEIETELSKDDRLGPWLCGPTYTAADIAFTCLLLRLYQIGLDDRMWKEGVRPNISVYQDMAFKRNSVKMATEWEKHTNEYMTITNSSASENSDHAQAAYWGMAAAGVLGAMYIYKKIRRS